MLLYDNLDMRVYTDCVLHSQAQSVSQLEIMQANVKHTSVGKEAIIMVGLKQAQQNRQDGKDHQNVDAYPHQVWQSSVQRPDHHCNAWLNFPAT